MFLGEATNKKIKIVQLTVRNKKNILLIGQTPPPFHGQAVATKLLFDHEWIDQKIYFLRMNFSQSETEVGRFSFRKVFHFWSCRMNM